VAHVRSRLPWLTFLPFNSFANWVADPVGLGHILADSVFNLNPFRGTDFLELMHILALVLALILPHRMAHIWSGLPWLAFLPFNSTAHWTADPVSLGDILADFVFNLMAVLLRRHWAVLGALDWHLLCDINTHLTSRHTLFPVHQAAAGFDNIMTDRGDSFLLADLLLTILRSPKALLNLGRPADLLFLLGSLPLQASLPLLMDGLALFAPLLFAHNLTATFTSRHPDHMANIGGSVGRRFANSFSDILAHLFWNSVALFWVCDTLLLSLINHLSDRVARFVSAHLIPYSVANFLLLLNVLALFLALVLPDGVAHVRSRLPRFTFLTFDSIAHWVANPVILGYILADLVLNPFRFRSADFL